MDADKKRAVLLTVVGKETYSLLSNLVAPAKRASKSYGELVAVIKAYLKPKVLVIAERFRFHQRRQRETETAAQYMAEQRKLADKYQFKDTWKKLFEIDSSVGYERNSFSVNCSH